MRLPTIQEAMKVAAYQAPLLSGGTMEAIGLIATQVKECEAAGVEILCCPEAVLGGLADYNRRPDDFAIDARGGQLRAVLAPIASRTVTTIVGFTEAGAEGRLFNSAAVVSEGEVVGVYRKRHRQSIGPSTTLGWPRPFSRSGAWSLALPSVVTQRSLSSRAAW